MYQLLCYIYPLIICGWDPPQVSTRWSRLEGIKEEFQGKRINTFLGIPYAEPPLGNLRFRPPSPLNSFNFFQYYAGNYRSTCLDRPYNAKSKGTEFIDESEDCLYLNIWSPEDSMSSSGPAKSAKLRSVLVYLNHEATDIRLINGKMLASLGDVVVVTFNYRSGSFSRIQDGDNDSSEKAIYHDTKAALEWIRENIQLFGGNSRSITVLAEGWVAVKTGLALEGKHFDKLIITKGPLDSNDIESPIDIKSIGLKSQSIGCVVPSKLNINSSSISSPAQSSDSSPISSYNEIIECLKKVNNKTMIADYCPNVCTFGKFCHNLISVTS